MTSSTLTLASIAILGLLVFLLGANVTRIRAQRGATGTQMPTDPADRLLIAQRAHGNAAEYAPMLALLLVVASVQSDGWWVPTLATVAVAARLLHAVGMLRSTTLATHGPLRDAGAMGTYLAGVALSITILVAAL
jgi:uncharacterized membrane protein YecN with MAPEG domain